MLRLLTKTATNKKLYKPEVADIWKRYMPDFILESDFEPAEL